MYYHATSYVCGKCSDLYQRLRCIGITNVDFINGDDHIPSYPIFYKSCNFIAVCEYMVKHDIKYVLYLEEDTYLYDDYLEEKRLKLLRETLYWAKNNVKSWDLVYFGSFCINPVFPVFHGETFLLRARRGQLMAHSMLMNINVAKKYLSDLHGQQISFDIWLSKTKLKVFLTRLNVFKQLSMIKNDEYARIEIDICQDAALFLWPVLIFGGIFASVACSVPLFLSK